MSRATPIVVFRLSPARTTSLAPLPPPPCSVGAPSSPSCDPKLASLPSVRLVWVRAGAGWALDDCQAAAPRGAWATPLAARPCLIRTAAALRGPLSGVLAEALRAAMPLRKVAYLLPAPTSLPWQPPTDAYLDLLEGKAANGDKAACSKLHRIYRRPLKDAREVVVCARLAEGRSARVSHHATQEWRRAGEERDCAAHAVHEAEKVERELEHTLANALATLAVNSSADERVIEGNPSFTYCTTADEEARNIADAVGSSNTTYLSEVARRCADQLTLHHAHVVDACGLWAAARSRLSRLSTAKVMARARALTNSRATAAAHARHEALQHAAREVAVRRARAMEARSSTPPPPAPPLPSTAPTTATTATHTAARSSTRRASAPAPEPPAFNFKDPLLVAAALRRLWASAGQQKIAGRTRRPARYFTKAKATRARAGGAGGGAGAPAAPAPAPHPSAPPLPTASSTTTTTTATPTPLTPALPLDPTGSVPAPPPSTPPHLPRVAGAASGTPTAPHLALTAVARLLSSACAALPALAPTQGLLYTLLLVYVLCLPMASAMVPSQQHPGPHSATPVTLAAAAVAAAAAAAAWRGRRQRPASPPPSSSPTASAVPPASASAPPSQRRSRFAYLTAPSPPAFPGSAQLSVTHSAVLVPLLHNIARAMWNLHQTPGTDIPPHRDWEDIKQRMDYGGYRPDLLTSAYAANFHARGVVPLPDANGYISADLQNMFFDEAVGPGAHHHNLLTVFITEFFSGAAPTQHSGAAHAARLHHAQTAPSPNPTSVSHSNPPSFAPAPLPLASALHPHAAHQSTGLGSHSLLPPSPSAPCPHAAALPTSQPNPAPSAASAPLYPVTHSPTGLHPPHQQGAPPPLPLALPLSPPHLLPAATANALQASPTLPPPPAPQPARRPSASPWVARAPPIAPLEAMPSIHNVELLAHGSHHTLPIHTTHVNMTGGVRANTHTPTSNCEARSTGPPAT